MAQGSRSTDGHSRSDSGAGTERSFDAALAAARAEPERAEAWTAAEELAAELQRPDELAAVYRDVLAGKLPRDLRHDISQRAARFHEEWFGDNPEAVAAVLGRIVEVDPEASWAFERLVVVLTVAEKWDALLDAYDRVLSRTSDLARRRALLDEAAHVAKDFAADPGRAVDYMQLQLELDPSATALVSGIERLLERQRRYEDLIELWQSRLPELPTAEARATRVRIAATFIDHIDAPGPALDELRALVDENPGHAEGCVQLERILAAETAPHAVRMGALSLLRTSYDAAERPDAAIAALERALGFARAGERVALHRDAGERLAIAGRDREALAHHATLLTLEPTDTDARKQLRSLAARSGLHGEFVAALEGAAAVAEPAQRMALRYEAAQTADQELRDPARAAELLGAVVEDGDADRSLALSAAHQLAELLSRTGSDAKRLSVLEQLAGLERATNVRRSVLGEVGRLAEALGDPDRALRAYEQRLADGKDGEALDAIIELLDRHERWPALAAALQRRADTTALPQQRRADLVRIARLCEGPLAAQTAAIETWMTVREEFGDEAETVDALDALLAQAGRAEARESVAHVAAQTLRDRACLLLGRLGDVRRIERDDPAGAAAAYADAISIDPRDALARAGLQALTEHDRSARVAAEALARAYGRTDEWQALLGLVDVRVRRATDPREAIAVLREAAALHERRAGDEAAALEAVAHAFTFDPTDSGLEHELLRLGTATGSWAPVADAYRTAVAVAAFPARAAHLCFSEGRIRERELADAEGAALAYERAAEYEPDSLEIQRAVVRASAAAGRWEPASAGAIALCRRRERLDDESLASLAAAVGSRDAWVEFLAGFARALAAADAADTLPRDLVRELELVLATWHRDRLDDAAGACAAARRASLADPTHLPTLRRLAAFEQEIGHPSRVDTLLRIDRLSANDVSALREACEIVVASGDSARSRDLVSALHRKAAQLLAHAGRTADPKLTQTVSWSLERWVEACEAADDRAQAIEALLAASDLPSPRADALALRVRAARACVAAGQVARGIDLLREVLSERADDVRLVAELADLCASQGRILEVVHLRTRELELTDDAERRLALRLELSRLVGELEQRGGRVESLQRNLAEQPGHGPSVSALAEILHDKGRHGALADILEAQASTLERQGSAPRSAELWAMAARLVEDRLGDGERAIAAWRHATDLVVDVDGLDALARLHLGRGDAAAAAGVLERRLHATEASARVPVLLRLARAQLQAEDERAATATLEVAFAEAPRNAEVRKLLLRLYRTRERWEPLGAALVTAAEAVADAPTILAYAREAAEIYEDRLGTPERAVPLVERAIALEPGDRELRRRLAEGLRAAGRLDEARALLDEIVADFGRRRSPERAAIHLALARVLHARDERAAALDQLELASTMDAGHPAITHMLAQTARENGQLERAERAYRALLLLLRRPTAEPAANTGQVTAGEVLVELASIAAERGQAAQAQELIESALETVANNDAEAPRLQARLRARGDHELLRRVLEVRLQHVDNRRRRAEALAELADLHDRALADPGRALELVLQAAAADPGSPELHDRARDLATRLDQLPRYAQEVEAQLDKARRSADVHVRCELLLRLGEVMARDRQDFARAAECFDQAEATGVREVDVWRAKARLAAERGDVDEHVRILEKLSAVGEDASETRADALYRMAEIQLADPETIERGLAALHDALATDPRHERAVRILTRATDPAAGGGSPEALALFEQVARKANDAAALLSALERRTALPDATPEDAREAVDLANVLAENDRAEALMIRAAELGRMLLDGAPRIVWALVGLANRRLEAGDATAAVDWFVEAAQAGDPDELIGLADRIAAHPACADRPELAVRVYEALLERDPSLRGAWEPLAALYRRIGDTDRLRRLVDETLDSLAGPDERNAMRMHLVHALVERGDPKQEVGEVLREVLRENPDHAEAAEALVGVLERSGRADEIVELVRQRWLASQARGDVDAIVRDALALAARMDRDDDEAREVLQTALLWAPSDRRIVDELLVRLGDDQFDERATLLERRIEGESPELAVRMAIELADGQAARGDADGELRALVLGYRRAPDDAAIRGRLERAYESRGDWRGMAEMLRQSADAEIDAGKRSAVLRQAAAIQRDLLHDPEGALALLQSAHAASPSDAALALELVALLTTLERPGPAAELIGTLLQTAGDATARRQLLGTRAELHLQRDAVDDAIVDLESAFVLDPVGVAPLLAKALDRRRTAAAEAGDATAERTALLRWVQVMLLAGQHDTARGLLTEWIDRERKDAAALLLMAEIDTHDERWDAVAKSCSRLVAIESGDAQVQAALRLSHAAQQMGRPEDARAGLEHARRKQPANREIQLELRRIYEAVGAARELARLLAQQAEETEDAAERIELVREASELFVAEGDIESAMPLIKQLTEADPGDVRSIAILADAYMSVGELDEADRVLSAALADTKTRKPHELAALHHRRSRVAGARGAHDEQLAELQAAFGHDKNDGQIAAELADLAEALEQWDLAVRALRTITLLEGPCPISRTSAFLRQARIAHRRGDRQRAVLWARKARHETPDSAEVGEFLAELGET